MGSGYTADNAQPVQRVPHLLKEDMQQYIGTKRINARPQTRGEYNDLRGWKIPDDENPHDEGYLVEYLDGGLANTLMFRGYISWSPKAVFEKSYHRVDGMTFSEALDTLKQGFPVARAGWNGKGMWLSLVSESRLTKDEASNLPYVVLCYPPKPEGGKGSIVPWLASQTDLLAEDWYLVF